ncbi:MAG: response regulator [Thiotrichaceae bacterium]|nr:response regulator [Thiotrichaceae bacterium]PCI13108.1 MAG: response regulator [Thiotrichales bacterium]
MALPVSVLIVDDSDSTRLVMAAILRKAGYLVSEARCGVEAIDMALKQTYSIVITDLHMPDMDGDSLVSCLRRCSQYQFTPILFASAESVDEIRHIGGEVRATGWISKPVKADKLLAGLRRLLSVD